MGSSDISDEALMAALCELTGCMLDPQLRAHLKRLEAQGLRVATYEVRETRAVLMIAYTGHRPSTAAIRAAYKKQLESAGSLN